MSADAQAGVLQAKRETGRSRQREQLRQRPRGKESCVGWLEGSSSTALSLTPHAILQPSSLFLARPPLAVTFLLDDCPSLAGSSSHPYPLTTTGSSAAREILLKT